VAVSNTSNGNGSVGKTYAVARDVVQFAAVPLISLLIWAWWAHETRLNAVENRMTARESNAWTAQDEAKSIHSLYERLDEMRTAILSEVPPPEVTQRLDAIDRRLERIEERLYQ